MGFPERLRRYRVAMAGGSNDESPRPKSSSGNNSVEPGRKEGILEPQSRDAAMMFLADDGLLLQRAKRGLHGGHGDVVAGGDIGGGHSLAPLAHERHEGFALGDGEA